MTKTVIVNSFRGGTGKSTMVSNLATAMAMAEQRVIIIDTDIQSPGIHAMFGLTKKEIDVTFTDYLKQEADISDCVYDVSQNFDFAENQLAIVPSSIAFGDLVQNLTTKKRYVLLERAIKKLTQEFAPDMIIIDTHPGINEEVLLGTELADFSLTIVRPDNQDYQGLEVSSSILKKLETTSGVIINKIHRKVSPKKLQKKIEKTFHIPVVGMFNFVEEIMISESQFIFSHHDPDHDFSNEIERVLINVFNIKPKEHVEYLHELLSTIKRKGGTLLINDLQKASKMVDAQFKEFAAELMDSKLVIGTYSKKKEKQFELTKRGRKFLQEYKSIISMIDDFGL